MQFLPLKFVCVKNAAIRLKLFIDGQSATATQFFFSQKTTVQTRLHSWLKGCL